HWPEWIRQEFSYRVRRTCLNTVEFDLQTAATPFRRGRDLIRSWNRKRAEEALLSLSFDPGDVSAGDRVQYEFGVVAPADGESLAISTERLSIGTGETRDEVIRTGDGARFYRVPATRLASKAKRQRKVSPSAKVGERAGSEWIRIDDTLTPALK